MTTPISTKVALSAAIVMGWTWLTALQCADVSGPPATIQQCTVTNDPDFPMGGSVSRNKPAECPVSLQIGTYIPYAATGTFQAGDVVMFLYQGEHIDWRGYPHSFIANDVWSEGNGKYFVVITGNYWAGIGGFQSDWTGWDDIRNGFYGNFAGDGWTYATLRIPYRYGVPSNSIAAPNNVDAGTDYSVSATTNDPLLTSPVTWSWYVDGSFAGTTADPQFTVHAGDPSTQQVVEVVATDGNGHSVSGQTTVWVNSGCGTQIIC